MSDPPHLLPTPQELILTGKETRFDPESNQPIDEIVPDQFDNDEAYVLSIKSDTITVKGATPKAVRYGHHTLNQLILQYGAILPTLEINDYPDYPNRGVMLDVSRDRVPTMKHLFEIIDILSSWKINHLQLYTEHTFAYQGHETVWQNASPITAEEIRQIDSYCHTQDITLAANQNCFGHMTRWLQHGRYSHLAETVDGWSWGSLHRPEPFSLCPIDPGSIELIDDLLGQLLPNFRNKLVNIGCDETIDVGQGRSKGAVEKHGFASVYFDFMDEVVGIVKEQGFKPMFWADMVLNHPESIARIPTEAIALVWGYEPGLPFGNWCSQLGEVCGDVWVCPGTSSWRSITGRTSERRNNICEFAQQGLDNGASGLMITDWGDLGHRQQFPVTLHGLAEGANAAWNVSSSEEYDSCASSFHAFGDKSGKVGEWLDRLGDVDKELRRNPKPLKNSSALFTDLHKPYDDRSGGWTVKDWHAVHDNLLELPGQLPHGDDKQVTDELKHTLDVAMFAVERAILRRGGQVTQSRSIDDIVREHRRLWLLRSRPGGLDDSCRYYEMHDTG